MTLSDKRILVDRKDEYLTIIAIPVEEIKASIKRIKKEKKSHWGNIDYCEGFNEGCAHMKRKIDEEMGDELTNGT